jgi:hypothetical protein
MYVRGYIHNLVEFNNYEGKSSGLALTFVYNG